MLSLEDHALFIKDVPKEYPIIYSGLSEPFGNPDTPAMMLDAHMKGHPIIAFSSLVGLKPAAADLIKNIPFERFTIHLPDPYGIANIKNTEDYNQSLNIILRNVERRYFMDMGYSFIDDHSEDRVRGRYPYPSRKGRMFCDHHVHPDYFVLPNGDAYFCCQTRGQTGKVGNLFAESYQQLLNKHKEMSYRMQTDPTSICHRCAIATPHWIYPIKKMFGEQLIEIGKRYFL